MSVTNIKSVSKCSHNKPVIPVRKLNHPYVLSDWLNAIIIERESLDPLVFVIFLFISSGLNSDVKLRTEKNMCKYALWTIVYGPDIINAPRFINYTKTLFSATFSLCKHRMKPFLVSICPCKNDFCIDSQEV